jgi:magnesium-transporting ATPase (P-type)
MGVREITPQQRDDWLKKYREANGATSGRKKKMIEVAEMIEKDMDIVGASAIEDKLQDGVRGVRAHV